MVMARGGRLAQKLTAQLSATVLERLLQAAALILIARQVGPAAFGQFAACLALTKILSIGFGLGLDIWLLRNGFRTGDYAHLAQQGTTCLALRAGLGLLWLGGIIVLAPWLDPAAYPPGLLVVTALAVWFEEIANIVWSTFKAALQNQTLLKFITGAQAASLGLTLLLIALGVRAVMVYAVAIALVTGLHAAVAVVWQLRTFGWQWRPETVRPILRETAPFALSAGLAMVYGRADIALVAHWLGERAAGLYSPAVSLVNALALIPTAVYYVMLPLLSQAYTADSARAETLANRFRFASTGLGLVFGAAVALVAHPLVYLLFGPAFSDTGRVLALLGGVLAARFVSMALATSVVAVGLQGQRVAIQAGVALLNIALNVWVIPRWGLMGVAGVYVFTEWVLVVGYAALVWAWRRNPSTVAT